MSLQFEITKIMHDLIKDYYNNYLEENKLILIPENEIRYLVEQYYENEKDYLKKTIRETLKTKFKTKFDKLAIENMIFEIFSDKDFAVNKIVRDISNYQNDNIIKINTIYKNDLGLQVDITEYGVYISNVVKICDSYNNINKGDYIIKINNQDLLSGDNNYKIDVLKNLKQITEQQVTMEIYKNS